MTPAEHYAEAERLLELAKVDVRDADNHADPARLKILDRASIAIAAANVHARLAQVSSDTAGEAAREAVTA